MRLERISARPHPAGNRIDLTWLNPEPDEFPRVRVVRRAGTHPISAEDGVVVPQFSLALGFQAELDDGVAQPSNDLRRTFERHQAPLTTKAVIVVDAAGSEWRILDEGREYAILKQPNRLEVSNEGLSFVIDQDLKGETVYYYTLFPYREDDPAEDDFDPHNRAAATATAPYNLAGRMAERLPRIYHRYDDEPPPDPGQVAPEDADKGQLRRFLDLPGDQLDQLYSLARAALELHNLDQVDGRLLPLLAEWIGWSTNYRLEIDAQRNEIRYAPHLYRRMGIIPALEATVKRLLGWECRTKEYAHNVFRSNCPERLNLWARERAGAGEWSEPDGPLSLDFAYEGRPCAVRDQAGTLWLFYHTRASRWDADRRRWREGWDIWYKTFSTSSVDDKYQSALDQGAISTGLREVFEKKVFPLSLNTTVEKQEDGWRIIDQENGRTYTLRREGQWLNVSHWTPSQPLTQRGDLDRHPSAALQEAPQGNRLWVFWDVYDEERRRWRIDGRVRDDDGRWSSWKDVPFDDSGGADGPERKRPCAVADEEGGLWLFWLEKEEERWRLKYNRHDGSGWGEAAQPQDSEDDARVGDDLFVLYQPAPFMPHAKPRLWVFWSRRVPIEAGQPDGPSRRTRRQIAYRFKEVEGDWGEVQSFEPGGGGEVPTHDDREPAARFISWQEIELFWSSNRDGSWSIWRSTGDYHDWGSTEPVTTGPYSQRDPLPILLARGLGPFPLSLPSQPNPQPMPFETRALLVYRSNPSLSYRSQVYGATQTLDARYAGSTTIDTRNLDKIALRGEYEDFQTYTYDTGPKGVPAERTWYNRGTVGLYLTPNNSNLAQIGRDRERVKEALRQFLPIQNRAVFFLEAPEYQELADIDIHEQFLDHITTSEG